MNLDILIFQQINGLAGQWALLDALGVFCAKYLIYILAIAVVVLFWKNWRKIFYSALAPLLARFGIAELIRIFWQRNRPFIENNVNLLVSHESTSAFPSGHASVCFALSYIVYRHNKKAGIVFFIASSLIAISRVFVGVHWPSDILGGAIVGIIAGWIIARVGEERVELS